MNEALSMERKFFVRREEGSSHAGEDLVDLMARWVKRIAEPAQIGERTGVQVNRSAARLGMSPNQVKKLWYRERRTIHAHEYLHVKRVVEAFECRVEKRAALVADSKRLRAQLRGRTDDQVPGPLGDLARPEPGDAD